MRLFPTKLSVERMPACAPFTPSDENITFEMMRWEPKSVLMPWRSRLGSCPGRSDALVPSCPPVFLLDFDRCLLADIPTAHDKPCRQRSREIQSARDVERDMLSVNGVLVKGSEGYPVVVGKVKRELARLVEPVAGSDSVGGGVTAPTDTPVRDGMERQRVTPFSQGWSRLPPLFDFLSCPVSRTCGPFHVLLLRSVEAVLSPLPGACNSVPTIIIFLTRLFLFFCRDRVACYVLDWFQFYLVPVRARRRNI